MRSGHPEDFGNAVRARRQQLNLTLDGVKAAGGPTGPTVIRAEAGSLEDPRPSTLSKFDTALQWEPGSAAGVFWERKPAVPRAAAAARALDAGTAAVELPLELVLEMMTTHRRLNDYVDSIDQPDAELVGIRSAFNGEVSRVIGMFVTDLLERNAGAGDGVGHPLLEYVFGELLSTEVVGHHDEVSEERLYRRWLMGKATGVSPAQVRKFRARLAGKRERS